MPEKVQKKLLLLPGLLLLMLACLAGCQSSEQARPSLYDAPTNVYEHQQIGAVLTLPDSWQILSEDEDSVVFLGEDGRLSLTLTWELGGYTYFSDEGLLDMAENVAEQVLQQPEILQRLSGSLPGSNQLVTALGPLRQQEQGAGEVYDKADAAPADAVCEVMIFSPLAALRYYVITVADAETYEQNAALLGEIYASFYLNQTEDELYAGLHRDAEESGDTPNTEDSEDTENAENNELSGADGDNGANQ